MRSSHPAPRPDRDRSGTGDRRHGRLIGHTDPTRLAPAVPVAAAPGMPVAPRRHRPLAGPRGGPRRLDHPGGPLATAADGQTARMPCAGRVTPDGKLKGPRIPQGQTGRTYAAHKQRANGQPGCGRLSYRPPRLPRLPRLPSGRVTSRPDGGPDDTGLSSSHPQTGAHPAVYLSRNPRLPDARRRANTSARRPTQPRTPTQPISPATIGRGTRDKPSYRGGRMG
jgi:hypothetical protein